jgi:GntR family transcriptional regulator
MILEIDFNSDEAIYVQLRNQIIMGIACEEFSDGESLPSVRQLAQVLGVNMHTVNKAYAILREEGYLKLDRRKGAVISVETLEKQEELESIRENLRMLVAEAVCKGVTEDEMNQLVHDMYQKIDRNQEEV